MSFFLLIKMKWLRKRQVRTTPEAVRLPYKNCDVSSITRMSKAPGTHCKNSSSSVQSLANKLGRFQLICVHVQKDKDRNCDILGGLRCKLPFLRENNILTSPEYLAPCMSVTDSDPSSPTH